MKLRFISPMMHGIVDYVTAAMLPVIPRVAGWDSTVTHLHDGLACTIATLAATTDSPVGIVKAVPMKTHLMIDGGTGATLMTMAALMDEEDCAPRCAMASVGAFLILQALCTQTHSRNKPTRDNAGRPNPMQRFAEERRPEAAYSY